MAEESERAVDGYLVQRQRSGTTGYKTKGERAKDKKIEKVSTVELFQM